MPLVEPPIHRLLQRICRHERRAFRHWRCPMDSPKCPSSNELADYAFGRLVEERSKQIDEHLPACADCLSAVTSVSAGEDTLVARLREPPSPGPFADESDLGEAIDRVRRLAHDSFEATQAQPGASPPAEHRRAQIGPYRLLEKLGEGGMGAVYRALHTKLDRVVALKLLPPQSLQSPAAVARFEREMRMVGKLDHANIVRATDADEEQGQHYLAMEYVAGVDLAELVRRVGPLPIPAACELVRQAAIGLQHAHDHGMVHRDIKPSNVMLTMRGEVKILDLGLAMVTDAVDHAALTSTGQAMGTLDYMAPEQCDDSHAVDRRADIYSLGAMLYKLLTGEPIYAGANRATPLQKLRAIATEDPPPIQRRRSDIPDALAAIVAHMVARDPAARFASASEVAAALAPLADNSELQSLIGAERLAKPTSAISQHFSQYKPPIAAAPPWHARRGWRLAAAGGAAAIALFALLFFLQTPHGTVQISIDDPKIRAVLTGSGVTILGVDKLHEIDVQPGELGLTITRGDLKFVTDTFLLKRGETTRLEIKVLPGEVQVVRDGKLLNREAIRRPLPPVADTTPPVAVAANKRSPAAVFATHDNPVVRLLFTPDGSQLITASNGDHHEIHGGVRFHVPGTDNSVRVWDVATGDERQRFEMSEGDHYGVQGLALSPRGNLLAASSGWIWANGPSQPRVYVWDITSGEPVNHFMPLGNHSIRAVTFTADGENLRISRSGSGGINTWNLKDGQEGDEVYFPKFTVEAPRMTWSHDGRLLLYGDAQTTGNVIAWNAVDESLAQTFHGHSVQPTHVAVSSDGKQVASCAADFSVRSWNTATGEPIVTLTKLGSEVLCVAFSADGRLLVSGAKDGALAAYDAASGERIARAIAHEGPVNDIACSTTGLCASGGHDGTVRLWTLPMIPTAKDSLNSK